MTWVARARLERGTQVQQRGGHRQGGGGVLVVCVERGVLLCLREHAGLHVC